MEKNFSNGTPVYIVDDIKDNVFEAIITSRQNADVYGVRILNGRKELCVPANSIFTDINDAKTELYARDHKRMMSMMDDIQDTEDLVRFLYTHRVALDENNGLTGCDLKARAVARMKANDLLGIEL